MPNIEIENLIKSFSESVKLVQQVKAQMDEIQDQISPEIKNVHSKSQQLLNAIGANAEEVFKKLDEREELVDEKCKAALEKIDQKMSEIGKVQAPSSVVTKPAVVTPKTSDNKVEGCSYKLIDGKVEIRFERIPSVAVRNRLKEHKFGWSKAKAAWIGNADRHPENVTLAKELAGEI
ncbi:hypothetical protein [uncultured Fibrobacter sp.]|uniref:hypothetical protein n=1 Tax=uncultured Fibrobacter sp. TaxID=261512 RepID=UPI00260C6A1D|nr:hypothetical protein [uncultured Fibrobacter sp.]